MEMLKLDQKKVRLKVSTPVIGSKAKISFKGVDPWSITTPVTSTKDGG